MIVRLFVVVLLIVLATVTAALAMAAPPRPGSAGLAQAAWASGERWSTPALSIAT